MSCQLPVAIYSLLAILKFLPEKILLWGLTRWATWGERSRTKKRSWCPRLFFSFIHTSVHIFQHKLLQQGLSHSPVGNLDSVPSRTSSIFRSQHHGLLFEMTNAICTHFTVFAAFQDILILGRDRLDTRRGHSRQRCVSIRDWHEACRRQKIYILSLNWRRQRLPLRFNLRLSFWLLRRLPRRDIQIPLRFQLLVIRFILLFELIREYVDGETTFVVEVLPVQVAFVEFLLDDSSVRLENEWLSLRDFRLSWFFEHLLKVVDRSTCMIQSQVR